MNRSDLIGQLSAKQPHLTVTDAELSVRVLLAAISNQLANGKRVEIRGFGSFSVHTKPSRKGRNPKTGEQVAVPEKRVPHFKPGVELRQRVDVLS